jgi:hypothetical protein
MATATWGPTLTEVVEDALSRGATARASQDAPGVLGMVDPGRGGVRVMGAGGPATTGGFGPSVLDAIATSLSFLRAGLGGEEAARAVRRLVLDVVAEALMAGGRAGLASGAERLLALDGADDAAPVLLLLSDEVVDPGQSRVATSDDVALERLAGGALLEAFLAVAAQPRAAAGDDAIVGRLMSSTPPDAWFGGGLAADLLARVAPEVVITRLPRMEPQCAPWPHLAVECGGQRSAAGVFATDADGTLGVTCCFHGAGPEGTAVTIGLRSYLVTRASEVQDLAFVALPGFNLPDLAGLAGARRERAPGQGDRARFDGATNSAQDTVVMSHDAGLLRKRPGVQLKVQTRPDTDRGSALIDEDDRVVGFAFEKTAFDDWPQFTDWIWAANALDALGLTPVAAARPTQGG